MVISMALHDLSMDIPWHSIYSDHTGKIRTMELTDFIWIPYIPHGIHVFLMEFHESPMGYSWVISIRDNITYSFIVGWQNATEHEGGNKMRWGRCLVTVFVMYLSVNKVAFVVIRSESAIVAPTTQFITMLVSVR